MAFHLPQRKTPVSLRSRGCGAKKAALNRIFEECHAAHLKQRDEEGAKQKAGK